MLKLILKSKCFKCKFPVLKLRDTTWFEIKFKNKNINLQSSFSFNLNVIICKVKFRAVISSFAAILIYIYGYFWNDAKFYESGFHAYSKIKPNANLH